MIDAPEVETAAERATRRRRPPVRATALQHAAHVRAWIVETDMTPAQVRETATERAVAQMFNDFDLTQEPSK